MFHSVARHFATRLTRKQVIALEDEDIYIYGMEMLVSTLANTIIGLCISLLLGQFLQGILFMAVFALLRRQTGGYHAKTHAGCITAFAVVLALALTIIRLVPETAYLFIDIILLIIANILIFKLAPIEHPNKPVAPERFPFHRTVSIVIALSLSAICFLGLALFPSLVSGATSIALSVFSVSVSMAVATQYNSYHERRLLSDEKE